MGRGYKKGYSIINLYPNVINRIGGYTKLTKCPYKVIEHQEHSIGRFNIVMDTLLIDGKTYPYSYEQVESCVCVLPIYKGKIVLIKQYRHTFKKWMWELPAGGLNGEDPETAARRELSEETGYIANRMDFLGVYPVSQGTSTAIAHMFVADCAERHEQHLEKTEMIEVHEVEMGTFKKMIKDREFTHTVGMIAWYLYRDSMER